jgi:hypothetical protein
VFFKNYYFKNNLFVEIFSCISLTIVGFFIKKLEKCKFHEFLCVLDALLERLFPSAFSFDNEIKFRLGDANLFNWLLVGSRGSFYCHFLLLCFSTLSPFPRPPNLPNHLISEK